jgi:Holliday junction resolvase RusA-like endonuclease
MNLPAEFMVAMNPMPCPRPRLSKWGVYYPAKYTKWRKEMVKAAAHARGKQRHAGAARELVVEIECHVDPPKKSKLLYPKPDVDNYAKAVLDGCNGILWADDSQIVALSVSKQWSDVRGGYIVIRISEA